MKSKFNLFRVQGKIKILPLIALTLLPVLGSGLIYYLTKDGINVYSTLEKPIFSPPPFIFMIVWPILYILMGLASYRIYMLRDQGENIGSALFFYIVQLLLNYLWPILFFSLRLYGVSFIELVILLIFIVITFIEFFKLDKISGILLIPYIIWVAFAGVLNFFLWMKNEM